LIDPGVKELTGGTSRLYEFWYCMCRSWCRIINVYNQLYGHQNM